MQRRPHYSNLQSERKYSSRVQERQTQQIQSLYASNVQERQSRQNSNSGRVPDNRKSSNYQEISRSRQEAMAIQSEKAMQEAKAIQAAKAMKAAQARQAALERQAAKERQAEEARRAEQARQAEEARRAEQARRAGQSRQSEQARQAARAMQAAGARKAASEGKYSQNRKPNQDRQGQQPRQAKQQSPRTKQAAAANRQAAPKKQPAQKRPPAKKKKLNLIPLVVVTIVVVAAIVTLVLIFAKAKVSEPLNIKITSTENSQTITWKRKGKNISFEIEQKNADGTYSLLKTISEDASTTCTASPLQSATKYTYKITSVKGSGEKSKRSEGVVVEAYTLPAQVTNLSASTQSKDSLTFVWNDMQNLTGYELKYSLSEDLSDPVTVNIPITEISQAEESDIRSYTVNELPEGTTYFYQFRSKCGDSAFSEWLPVASAKVTHAIDMTGIDVNAPMVALTFDDGPEGYDITSRILDALASVGGHATFFQLGDRVEGNPDKIQRMVAEGHEVGNHTYDHTHMGNAVTAEDIIRCSDAIESVCGVRPTCFRSPGGETTGTIKDTCVQENMALFYWSVDTRDWSSRDADAVVSSIKNNVEDGDIILMHNIYDSTAQAVERIVPWLKEQGYQLVTVPQLFKAKTDSNPTAGVEYITATKTLDR